MDVLTQLNLNSVNKGGNAGDDLWLGSESAGLLTTFNPNTGEAIAQVELCDEQDYQQILEKSHQAFLAWRQLPAPERGQVIREIGDELRRQKDLLGSLVAMEMGKSKQEGDGEVQEMIDIADFAVGQSRMLYGNTMHSERPQHRMYEQWHPLGVVGVISAFNFPVAVWAWNAFIAAICGNSVLWKPSSKTPLCAIAVQHICNKVLSGRGLPGIFSMFIPKDHHVAEVFVNDSRVPLVSFTGSTKAGRHVAQLVARRLGKYLLELGGNNAIILDETAELNLAIPAIVFGAVGTAGQRCTSTRRVFIHQSRYDEVVAKLSHAYQQVTIGNAMDENNLMGPLIDEGAVQNFEKAIERLKQLGAKIIVGGERLQQAGFFVQPTIVEAKNDWDIVQEETFAPILYVMPYQDISDAIAMHNGVKQGLSSAIFSMNIQQAERFLSAAGSDCGIANVNIGTSGAEIGGAFGGEKDTGGGREAGSDSWKAYMRRQTNTINWSNDLPLAQGIKFDL